MNTVSTGKDAEQAVIKPGTAAVTLAVAGYMICSSLMLIVNKLAVHHLPAPSTVLLCQLVLSAVACKTLGVMGVIEVENLSWTKIQQFWIVPLAFLGTVFANIKILQNANVETFIVFRSSTPLMISVADYLFLGRELPDARNWGCLGLLLAGAVGYVVNDKFFRVDAYVWVLVWFAVFSFDQIYIKHKVDTVKMTTWTQVYYTNSLASPILLAVLISTDELSTLAGFTWTNISIFWLVASAILGIAIAYFSFMARAAVSATYFTVIGNTCKVLTVIINVVMWDLHASPAGLLSLFVCLVGAYLYKQAPLRISQATTPAGPQSGV
jgi:solute carrier family 35 protein